MQVAPSEEKWKGWKGKLTRTKMYLDSIWRKLFSCAPFGNPVAEVLGQFANEMFASEQLGKWDLVQLDQNRVKLSVLNPMILRSNSLQYHLSIKDPVLISQICTKMPIFIIWDLEILHQKVPKFGTKNTQPKLMFGVFGIWFLILNWDESLTENRWFRCSASKLGWSWFCLGIGTPRRWFLETIEINQHVLVNLWDEIETWAIMFKMSDLND